MTLTLFYTLKDRIKVPQSKLEENQKGEDCFSISEIDLRIVVVFHYEKPLRLDIIWDAHVVKFPWN